ncbi:hypothetical protein ACMFMF_002451 [Clarireedia jacksonii]
MSILFGAPYRSKANSSSRHYSYECKANAQERPYVSRPSRTQQLLNPKLVPKLTSDVPQELLRNSLRKGIADEQLAKAQLEKDRTQLEKDRGRKRERDDDLGPEASKRRRSLSSASSVSTISTNISRSPSPRETRLCETVTLGFSVKSLFTRLLERFAITPTQGGDSGFGEKATKGLLFFRGFIQLRRWAGYTEAIKGKSQ